MNIALKIAALISANAIGFSIAPLSVNLALLLEIFTAGPDSQTTISQYFLHGTMIWMVCGLLSLGYLFLKTKLRFVMIVLPIIIPLLYSLKLLIPELL